MHDRNLIPKEIDMHYQLYSKEPWEVRFGKIVHSTEPGLMNIVCVFVVL
jgi:hypothetical protein